MSSRPTSLGKFELLGRIAKGGMAEIYLARQAGIEAVSRIVVLKRILPHLAEEEQFVRMFLEEARLAMMINHPNVVQIVDVGEQDGEYFIAMEYIDGPSVGLLARNARRSGTPLPYTVAAEIAAQAADGLHAAHELRGASGEHLGLVHRDVSPHNLMLTTSGVVKLVDFGIAKAKDSAVKTSTGSIKGKFPYMSPEQCRGDPLDRRTDIFSLGIVIAELLVAERLFQRPTELMTLKAITEDELVPPREKNRQLPEELNAVLMRALERDPARRFASGAELAAALRSALAGLAVRTSPESLAHYIAAEYGGHVAEREAGLRELSRRPTGSVPEISGFASTSRDTEPEQASRAAQTVPQRELRPAAEAARERPPPRRAGRRFVIFALVAVLGGLGLGLGVRHLRSRAPAGPPLRFGIVPAFRPSVVKSELAPFGGYLSRALGRPVEIVVPRNYRRLREQLLQGKLHFAALSPLQFVLARARNSRVKAIAAQRYAGARSYQGYLVVRAESPLQQLWQLRGQSICYVDRGSTSGYLLARHFLREQGFDPDQLFQAERLSGSHGQVMRDLLAKRCDVGAIYSGAYLTADRHQVAPTALRTLAVTGVLPLDVICAAPELPPRLLARLRRALLAFDPTEHLDRPKVSEVYPITGFATPKLASFDGVAHAAKAEGLLE